MPSLILRPPCFKFSLCSKGISLVIKNWSASWSHLFISIFCKSNGRLENYKSKCQSFSKEMILYFGKKNAFFTLYTLSIFPSRPLLVFKEGNTLLHIPKTADNQLLQFFLANVIPDNQSNFSRSLNLIVNNHLWEVVIQ